MPFILTDALERSVDRNLPAPISAAVTVALEHLREGCFQRSLCLIVATTSVASGLEVGYEHYKGSYSNPVMYTPVASERSTLRSRTLRSIQPRGCSHRSSLGQHCDAC